MGSLTGSLDHPVSWFSRLFPDHVYPEPDSDTWKPNDALAMTFSHGAGVDWSGPRIVMYSRPPSAKPPRPLKYSSFGRDPPAGVASTAETLRAGRGIGFSGRSSRTT